MIAVIGGTGTTGREIVKGLREAGAAFRCIVRDTGRAEGQLGDNVVLIEGDLAAEAALLSTGELGPEHAHIRCQARTRGNEDDMLVLGHVGQGKEAADLGPEPHAVAWGQSK